MAVPAAYPFIEVRVVPPPAPVAQRAPGVIAIVGQTGNAASATGPFNTPIVCETLKDAEDNFARVNAGVLAATPLYNSIALAMMQQPKPSKIYGVRVNGTDYASALASLDAVDDVTFVALANESAVGVAAAGGNPPTNLMALKAHVENVSAGGLKRIGVAMVNPATPKAAGYPAAVAATSLPLKSDTGRMILVAGRGATTDVAVAAMAAIAGYEPHISTVLKQIRGVSMPKAGQYSPSEIIALSNENIIPILDPSLVVGDGLFFGEGRLYSTDAQLLYIDVLRTLDDIEFRLKAGLVGLVGDARITKAGMTLVKSMTEGILEPLQRRRVIDKFQVQIPVLDILNTPDSTWTAGDQNIVTTARATRVVDMIVSVWYGPAVHRLKVDLVGKF
jgi:hypothetical protein